MTDIQKSELVVIKITGQDGKVLRIVDGDGGIAAITMADKDMIRLQRYINTAYPLKAKCVRLAKAKKAVETKKVCEVKTAKFDAIVQAVCDKMGLTPDAVLSGKKFRELCDARTVITYLARKCSMSYPELADLFNEKTHASALIRIRAYHMNARSRIRNGQTLEQIALAVQQELELG